MKDILFSPKDIKGQGFKCCEKVWRGWGGMHSTNCGNKAKIEVDGKPYCGVHDPVRIAGKDAAKAEQRGRERDAAEIRTTNNAIAMLKSKGYKITTTEGEEL